MFESAWSLLFASCHLEGEDRALIVSSYMSFYPVGVGHAAKPRNEKKNKTPSKTFRMLKEA